MFVSELFGPTFQGEGPYIGQPALFLRLAGCNLTCAYCDTKYASEGGVPMTVADVLAWATGFNVNRLVITGGEPLLQWESFKTFVHNLLEMGWCVEIETNGTVCPNGCSDRVHFNVSPKLAASGMAFDRRVNRAVLEWHVLRARSVFKFALAGPGELDEIQALGLPPDRVSVMPLGTDAPTTLCRMRSFAEAALALGYRVLPRLHILLWGNKRGV